MSSQLTLSLIMVYILTVSLLDIVFKMSFTPLVSVTFETIIGVINFYIMIHVKYYYVKPHWELIVVLVPLLTYLFVSTGILGVCGIVKTFICERNPFIIAGLLIFIPAVIWIGNYLQIKIKNKSK